MRSSSLAALTIAVHLLAGACSAGDPVASTNAYALAVQRCNAGDDDGALAALRVALESDPEACQAALVEPAFHGEGGTIPFMAMLGDAFPAAQFVITGVLGPESNAHGPNEFLDVAYAEKLTGVLARVLQASSDGLAGGA